jgi:hypothetical protein
MKLGTSDGHSVRSNVQQHTDSASTMLELTEVGLGVEHMPNYCFHSSHGLSSDYAPQFRVF